MAFQGSVGVPALRVVWILGCAAWALADRATQPLDDAVSMIQVTRLLSEDLLQAAAPTCQDTSGAALDAQGRDCEWCSGRRLEAGAGLQSSCCTHEFNDDDDFTASLMCCDCGGGAEATPAPTASSPTPTPTEAAAPICQNTNGGALGELGRDCNYCDQRRSEAGVGLASTCCSNELWDDSDFTSSLMCCVCGGGAVPTPSPTPPPTEACVDLDGGATDSQGHTCVALSTIKRVQPHGCGLYDDDDFTGNILCCLCGGGGPTAAPTPAPTAPAGEPSTPAPPQEASVTGDPHVTNVDGARFDIMRAGVHEFLRLPRRANGSRGSEEPEPLLSVSATVERADEEVCRESYLKQVYVTGGWLHSCGPLRFRAGGGALDDARAISISVNGSQVSKEALGLDDRVRPFLATESRASHVNPVSGTIQKVPMFTVKLSFEAATLKIDWMHRAVPSGLLVNHLNFQALGLRKFLDGAGMDIGGILGRDGHGYAASLPEDCRPAGSNLRVSGRASGEEGSLQMIIAAL